MPSRDPNCGVSGVLPKAIGPLTYDPPPGVAYLTSSMQQYDRIIARRIVTRNQFSKGYAAGESFLCFRARGSQCRRRSNNDRPTHGCDRGRSRSAITMGHPLCATGAIILGTMLDELKCRHLNTALITLGAGNCLGAAIIIEQELGSALGFQCQYFRLSRTDPHRCPVGRVPIRLPVAHGSAPGDPASSHLNLSSAAVSALNLHAEH